MSTRGDWRSGGRAARSDSSSKGQVELAELLLVLADRPGVSEGPKLCGVDGKASLEALSAQGVIRVEKEGGLTLGEEPETFMRAFSICDASGKSSELLRTDYAVRAIGAPLLSESSKGLVLISIVSLLRLLSSAGKEASEDPSLLDLGEALSQNEELSSCLDNISVSLEEVGFRALLDLGLSGIPKGEREAVKAKHLLEMAQKDVEMFFAEEPPIPALGGAFVRLLFPEDERSELLFLLRSSSSAMRALLFAQGARSGSLALPVVVQTLPLLEHLFHLFAVSDPKKCDPGRRERAGHEVALLVDDLLVQMPSPSPLLAALRRRMAVDTIR